MQVERYNTVQCSDLGPVYLSTSIRQYFKLGSGRESQAEESSSLAVAATSVGS